MFGSRKRAARGTGTVRLGRDAAGVVDEELLEAVGLTARRVVDDGPLRVSLIALAAGGRLAAHRTAGPLVLHVLAGGLDCRVGARTARLAPGDMLSLGAGVEHEVASGEGARFLLTVVDPAGCPGARCVGTA